MDLSDPASLAAEWRNGNKPMLSLDNLKQSHGGNDNSNPIHNQIAKEVRGHGDIHVFCFDVGDA
jgi:hypothetical protein